MCVWVCVCVCKGIYHKYLAHAIMEIGPYMLSQSASWSPSGGAGVVPVEGWPARDPGRANVSVQVQRQGKQNKAMSQLGVGQAGVFLPSWGKGLPLWFWPLTGQTRPTVLREATGFTQATDSNVNCIQKTQAKFDHTYGHPMAQSRGHIK